MVKASCLGGCDALVPAFEGQSKTINKHNALDHF